MKVLTANARKRRRAAFTLVELMVASSIAAIIGAGALILLLESAKEDRRGLADASVEQSAAMLQNQLMAYLRGMSATEGVVFATPTSNTNGTLLGYQSVIVARGPAPDFPREQISFTATNGAVVYQPNRTVSTGSVILTQNTAKMALRTLYFSPSLKSDGTPDNALVNVYFRMDDRGFSGRTGAMNPAAICRSFSVRMRNS